MFCLCGRVCTVQWAMVRILHLNFHFFPFRVYEFIQYTNWYILWIQWFKFMNSYKYELVEYMNSRVVYHGVTSSFFGIGILPVSDLTGRSVFRSVLLVWRELLFSTKGGLAVSKKGQCPLFPSKRGPVLPFWGKRGFRKKNDTKMYRPRFPLVLVW